MGRGKGAVGWKACGTHVRLLCMQPRAFGYCQIMRESNKLTWISHLTSPPPASQHPIHTHTYSLPASHTEKGRCTHACRHTQTQAEAQKHGTWKQTQNCYYINVMYTCCHTHISHLDLAHLIKLKSCFISYIYVYIYIYIYLYKQLCFLYCSGSTCNAKYRTNCFAIV